MKKLLLVLLAALLALSLALPAFASDGDAEYDEAELKATLREAFDLYRGFYDAKTSEDFEGDPIELYPGLEHHKGVYYKRTGKYALWKDVLASLDAAFTKEAKEIFMEDMRAEEIDGYTYSTEFYAMAQAPEYYIDYEFDEHKLSLDDTFKVTNVDSDRITAEFQLHAPLSLENVNDEEFFLITRTVEYTKENGEWRISGGSFFEPYLTRDADVPNWKEAWQLVTGTDEYYRYVRSLIDQPTGEPVEGFTGGQAIEITSISYDELLKKAGTVFTGQMSEKMTLETGRVVLVNGKLYAVAQGDNPPFGLVGSSTGPDDGLNIKVEAGNTENTAVIRFNYVETVHNDAGTDEQSVSKETTLTVEKVNGEWRVSGGEYIDMILDYSEKLEDGLRTVRELLSEKAPKTGDAAPMLIVLAAASAFTAVIFRRRIRAK